MRRIGGVVAILLILGLAAVGLIYAQKNTAASSSAVVASTEIVYRSAAELRKALIDEGVPQALLDLRDDGDA